MKSLFINPEDIIKVKVFTSKTKDKEQMIVANKREILEKNENVDVETITEDEVVFRRPSYGDNVLILSKGVNIDGSGEVSVNPNVLRYSRFVTLLKDWTFKDDNGNKLEPNATNINTLHDDLASFILDEMESKI